MIDPETHALLCDWVCCTQCGYDDQLMDDMVTYDVSNPVSMQNTLSTSCCHAILCPKCVVVNKNHRTISTNHLFIKSVIYLQPGEDIEAKVFPQPSNADCCEPGCQYNWVLYEPLPAGVNLAERYEYVDENYNAYSIDKILKKQGKRVNQEENSDDDDSSDNNSQNSDKSHVFYTDVNALCECKTCGFQCLAQNYMDS